MRSASTTKKYPLETASDNAVSMSLFFMSGEVPLHFKGCNRSSCFPSTASIWSILFPGSFLIEKCAEENSVATCGSALRNEHRGERPSLPATSRITYYGRESPGEASGNLLSKWVERSS